MLGYYHGLVFVEADHSHLCAYLGCVPAETSTNFHLGARKSDAVRHVMFLSHHAVSQLDLTVTLRGSLYRFLRYCPRVPATRIHFVFRSGPWPSNSCCVTRRRLTFASQTTIPRKAFTVSVTLCFVTVCPLSSLQRSCTPADFLHTRSFVPLV